MQAWQRVDDGTNVSRSGFRKIVHKQFRMSDGTTMIADINGLDGAESVATIALTPDNQVIVARQFRCGPEQLCDELPGGFVDAGETPEQAARREMAEEVGYVAHDFEYLGHTFVDAWDNTTHHYFLARNCYPVESNNPEPTEEIEVRIIPISELFANAHASRMTDVQGVFFAYDTLKELEGSTQ